MKKYEKIYELLKTEILSGAYPYGARLPSKRTLAEENGVSLSTAETALDILRSEGYIDSAERSGFFCAYRESDFLFSAAGSVSGDSFTEDYFTVGSGSVAAAEAQDAESGKYAFGAPLPPSSDAAAEAPAAREETFPFTVYARAMRRVLAEYGEKLLEKPPKNGVPQLKSALKNYLLRSRALNVNENQIVIGAGAEYLYGVIAELLGTGRIYGTESPAYGQIARVYAAKGAQVRLLRIGADGILSGELAATDADVLHVTPYRSYPTLATATATKKAEYLRFAREKNGYVVEDDYLSEFSPYAKPAETLFGADEAGRVIYVNTFSKTLSPALRAGYMLLPPALAVRYEEELGFYSCPVPATEQYVLAALLSDGSFERHINRLRRRMRNAIDKNKTEGTI